MSEIKYFDCLKEGDEVAIERTGGHKGFMTAMFYRDNVLLHSREGDNKHSIGNVTLEEFSTVVEMVTGLTIYPEPQTKSQTRKGNDVEQWHSIAKKL